MFGGMCRRKYLNKYRERYLLPFCRECLSYQKVFAKTIETYIHRRHRNIKILIYVLARSSTTLVTEGPGLGREKLKNLPYFMYKKT